jgi:hypothetical protein
MITGYALAVGLCVMVVALLFVLMRTRRIREKYAGIWIVVSIGVIVLAIFPKFTFWLSKVAGVISPVNLLFAVAIGVLLAVCIQLSTEVSTLEEETRTIAEELALLRLEVRSARDATRVPVSRPVAAAPAPAIVSPVTAPPAAVFESHAPLSSD